MRGSWGQTALVGPGTEGERATALAHERENRHDTVTCGTWGSQESEESTQPDMIAAPGVQAGTAPKTTNCIGTTTKRATPLIFSA